MRIVPHRRGVALPATLIFAVALTACGGRSPDATMTAAPSPPPATDAPSATSARPASDTLPATTVAVPTPAAPTTRTRNVPADYATI